MRLLQIWLPNGTSEAVSEKLETMELDYVTSPTSTATYDGIVSIPIPRHGVESLLSELRKVGIDEHTHTVVLEPETVVSRSYEDLEGRFKDEPASPEAGITGDIRIAREELESRSHELVLATPTYVVLTIVSAIVATAGLLLDSPATVVGSMVIAPLIGPSLAASVGTVLGDHSLFRQGIKLQLLGIAVAVGGAVLFGLFVRYFYLVPPGIEILALEEVNERAAPNFLVLAIALGAGVAGILSLMTGVSTALVGVMIAVALIPPAAAVGVGISFGVPRLALGAGVIVIVNVLSINLASLSLLWFEGYRPDTWLPTRAVRWTLVKQVLTLVLSIAVVSSFLVGVTYDSYTASTTEEELRASITTELEDVDGQLQLHTLEVDRTGIVPPLETERVIITVAVDPEDTIPELHERLTDRVEEITDGPTAVEIRFILVQQSV